jgi:site-specific recombinase XerD
MGHGAIKLFLSKLKDRSKIHFYPHSLRQTFATLMLEGGCDIFSLSKMMGHSDIKTTTIHLSATTAHLQEQIKKHPLDCMV